MIIELWLAIAWTLSGPIIGTFETYQDCAQAAALAKVCSNVDAVTDCFRVVRPTDITPAERQGLQ
jgi:hypothetical protein